MPRLIPGLPLDYWHSVRFCESGWKGGSIQALWDRTRVHCHPLYSQGSSINPGEQDFVRNRKRRTWGRWGWTLQW